MKGSGSGPYTDTQVSPAEQATSRVRRIARRLRPEPRTRIVVGDETGNLVDPRTGEVVHTAAEAKRLCAAGVVRMFTPGFFDVDEDELARDDT